MVFFFELFLIFSGATSVLFFEEFGRIWGTQEFNFFEEVKRNRESKVGFIFSRSGRISTVFNGLFLEVIDRISGAPSVLFLRNFNESGCVKCFFLSITGSLVFYF